jgi:hypothetical protein
VPREGECRCPSSRTAAGWSACWAARTSYGSSPGRTARSAPRSWTRVLGRVLLVDPRRITVDVDGGVVTLGGQLDLRADAQVAVRLVERVEGVVAVVDRLTYRYDERLADTKIAPLT